MQLETLEKDERERGGAFGFFFSVEQQKTQIIIHSSSVAFFCLLIAEQILL